MVGKSWSMSKYLPGKKTLAAGATLLAGVGAVGAAMSGGGGAPDYSAGLQGMKAGVSGKRMTECDRVMCHEGIRTRGQYKRWAARGGHPDKGGSTSKFQQVNNCQMSGQFCNM